MRARVVGLLAALLVAGLLTPVAHAAVTPALSVVAPGSGTVGQSMTFTGTLAADQPGGQTVALRITRRFDGLAPAQFGSASTTTTAPDGSFQIQVTPDSGGYYVVHASVAALSVDAVSDEVLVPGNQSYVRFSTPPAAYVTRPFTVTGHVGPVVGALAAPATVHLVRQVGNTLAGVSTLPDVVTAADGTFAFTDRMDAVAAMHYSATWDGSGDVTGSHGALSLLVVPIPVTISTSVSPDPPSSLDWLDLAAAVSFGGEPAPPGLVVQVTRTGDGQTVTSTISTGTDGVAHVVERPGAGTWSYALFLPGSATHSSGRTSRQVVVSGVPRTITVGLAPGAVARWNAPIRVSGRVASAPTPIRPRVQQVFVEVSGSCQPYPVTYSAGPVDALGNFTADVSAPCLQQMSMRAEVVPDGVFADAYSPTVSVPVAKGPPIFQLDTSSGTGIAAYGGGWLYPQVFGIVGSGTLDVYVQPYGGAKTLLARRTLAENAAGISIAWAPTRRTVVTLVYHGDAGLLPGAASFVVQVRPELYAYASGGSTSHGWAVIPRSGTADEQATMAPSRPGGYLTLTRQRYLAGAWRTVTTRVVREDVWGNVDLPVGRQAAGSYWRFRVTWRGGTDLAPATSDWAYYRFA